MVLCQGYIHLEEIVAASSSAVLVNESRTANRGALVSLDGLFHPGFRICFRMSIEHVTISEYAGAFLHVRTKKIISEDRAVVLVSLDNMKHQGAAHFQISLHHPLGGLRIGFIVVRKPGQIDQ